MKKTLFSLLLLGAMLTCLSVSSLALPVDQQQARSVAATFLTKVNTGISQKTHPETSADLTLVYTGFQTASENAAFYVFGRESGGWVMVAADDAATPIIAYSYEGSFNSKEMPANVNYWLQRYSKEMALIASSHLNASAEIQEQWLALLSGNVPTTRPDMTAVSAMMTTTWNQDYYYWDLCPYDTAAGRHCYTGCSATATAQIMKYWNFPATGTGSHSYTTDSFGTLSASFGSTTYQWSSMPDALNASSTTTQVNAVATLMYHLGVAAEMNYSVNSSTAATVSYHFLAPSMQNALRNYFKYSSDISIVYPDNPYYEDILASEMVAGRPVLYTGFDTSEGHAFVFDGCDNNGQFHVNWGWGGYCDGYYVIGSLNPSVGGAGGNSSGTYNLTNYALIGIRPNHSWGSTTTVTATALAGGTVTGSGTYAFGDTVVIYATATDLRYGFSQWNDGSTENPRRFIATGGTYSFTATFDICTIDEFPYTVDFENVPACWSITDANADGNSWYFLLGYGVGNSCCAAIRRAVAADDWLTSPSITTPGTYTLSWAAKNYSASYPESYEVYAIGDTNTLLFRDTIGNCNYTTRSVNFSVNAGDTVAISFRYISDDKFYLFLDDVRIAVLDTSLPDVTISDVSTSLMGIHDANVTFTVTPNAACTGYDIFILSERSYNTVRSNVSTYGGTAIYRFGIPPYFSDTVTGTFTVQVPAGTTVYIYACAHSATDTVCDITTSVTAPMGGGTGIAFTDIVYYGITDTTAFYSTIMNDQTAYYYLLTTYGSFGDHQAIVNHVRRYGTPRYSNSHSGYAGLTAGDTLITYTVSFNQLGQLGRIDSVMLIIGQGVVPNDCSTPIIANLDTATATSLSISWNAVYTATGYNISYAPYTHFSLDSLNWVYDAVGSNTFTVSGLSPSTKYVFRISPNCTDTLVYDFCFSTECSFISLPYTNTFDVPYMIHQPCWTIHGHFYYWFNSSGQRWPGSAYGETALAVLPIYDTTVYPSVAALRMKVSLKATNVDNYFIAGIMTDPSDTTTFVEIGREEAPTQGFADFTFDFSSYTGTGHYVAFRLIGADGVIFDNILLEETPACVEVTDLIVSNVAKNSAILQWSASYTASSYMILYRTAEATTWDTLTSACIDTTATLTGLISNTEYNVTVFSNCSDNSSDAVSAVLHTKCENVSLPYSVDFAADPSMYHQYCWTLHGEFTSWHNSTTFWPGTHGQPAYAVLPMYDTVTNPDVSQLQLSMTLTSIDTGNYLVVGVMDDPYDTNSFVEVARIEATVDNFVPVKLSLKGYSGSGRYVAFKALGSAGIIFDSITLQPTCFVTTMGQAIACDSYLWRDGVTYAASGTYCDTVLTSRGCDSVVTLNLTINTSSSFTDVQTGCDSYTWSDGVTYTASTSAPTRMLANAVGCDSVVTLNLTINASSSSTDVQTGCDSYTWSDGVTYTASTSAPTRTLANAVGCDSVVTLNLTINASSSSTDVQTGCDSYTWSDGVTYTASTSAPTRTLVNAVGCDSVVTLNLTINASSSSTDVQTGCDSYTWSDGVTYTASTSAPTRTLVNAVGCDSVVTLNLTINASSLSTDVQTGCDSYTWSDGVTYTASTSAPTRTLANAVGCDSVVTLNLTINASSTTSLNETICEGDSYVFDGESVTSTGSYVDTLTNAAGCDSIVTLMLTVYPTYSDTIHAEIQEGETYNENGFSENEAGTYVRALQTMTGCDSTIVLVLTFNVGIDDAGTLEGISLYPNPTAGWVTIDAAEVLMIEVVDNAGRRVAVSHNVNRIDLSRQPAGNYILRITTPHGIAIRKVVRQ